MKKLIISSVYSGPLFLWKTLVNSGLIVLECKETYQKKSFRNRCEICSSKGVEALSIPLKKGKHSSQNIRSVKIAYEINWMKDHLKKIKEAYVRSPYFDFYYDQIACIIQSERSYLYDLNLELIKWVINTLEIEVELKETDEYIRTYDGFTDLRSMKYSSTRDYDLSGLSHTYPQVFEYKNGFIPNLSILDLIMNQGPESIKYLKEMDSE